jgi:hypothetical protein
MSGASCANLERGNFASSNAQDGSPHRNSVVGLIADS